MARFSPPVVTLQDLVPFEALERLRSELPKLVSHELRTPLAAIRGSASTALEDREEAHRDELRQYLRIVAEQAGRMSRLIGDLLDSARVGAGTLAVDPAPKHSPTPSGGQERRSRRAAGAMR